jgi:hypothetical protein
VAVFPYSNNRLLYPPKVGLLFETEDSPRKLAFIPIQTPVEYIDNVDYRVNTTVNFRYTNGGRFDDLTYFKSFFSFFKTGSFSEALD